MSELKDMPVVTVEQIVRFREKAIKIEKQRDKLLEAIKLIIVKENSRVIITNIQEIYSCDMELKEVKQLKGLHPHSKIYADNCKYYSTLELRRLDRDFKMVVLSRQTLFIHDT
jgi:predicted nucleic acid-binding protein